MSIWRSRDRLRSERSSGTVGHRKGQLAAQDDQPGASGHYGKRFTIEESLRDIKDDRFGLGLKEVRTRHCGRRDRLIWVCVLAHTLLTLLGAAGEAEGLDRLLKSNTSKKRQHSLFRQGLFWYDALPNMPEKRLRRLMKRFDQMVQGHAIFREVLEIL